MKSASVILAFVLVCTNAVEDQDVLQQWTKFQAEFSKSYRSPLEARKRLGIFQENLKVIEKHNRLFEKGQTSFTMGVNQFADWTDSEFTNFVNKGLFNDTNPLRSQNVFVKPPNFVASETVDWREKGIVTDVKNQGHCGGCWAFSATGAIEGQYALNNGEQISLSEQCLIDCSRNENNKGCNGGLMTSAFDYVKEYGIATEDDYIFEEQDGICKKYGSATKISEYVTIQEGSEADLTAAIQSIGPVSVGIDASSSLQHYKHGIFSGYCSNTRLNHAVLAVGYGSEYGKDFYILKNSWGVSWGEHGYFRLSRNAGNMCGVSSMAAYPVVNNGAASYSFFISFYGILFITCISSINQFITLL